MNDPICFAVLASSESEAREAAESTGYRLRVVCRDGEYLCGTQDLDMRRVNVELVNGFVVSSHLG